MFSSNTYRKALPGLGAAIPLVILFITFLSIPLAAAKQMELSPQQTSSWLLIIYGLPGILSLALTLHFHQLILITGNVFVLIFIASLAEAISYAEFIGASMLAGFIVIFVTGLGIANRLTTWIPAPIVFGLLAGAITPFVVGVFDSLTETPIVVGGAFLAYLWGHRALGKRLPATLPALIVGLLATALTAQFGEVTAALAFPTLTFTMPVFSVRAISTITPVFFVLITLQANLPSVIFMRSQDYDAPDRVIYIVSGIGTVLGGFLGPIGVSLSLPATSLVAGEAAGDHDVRHRSVYYAGGASVLIGVLAGVTATLPEIIPLTLLLAVAGLALVDVLSNALQQITQGSLLLGPLFTFAIALSQETFLGLDSFFWALVIGTGVSWTLERDALKSLRDTDDA